MEIDVFYKNDDLSFGFDGNGASRDDYNFAKKAQYGFPDVDYSYATGISAYGEGYPQPSWGATQKEAYKRLWVGWKSSYKKDCQKIQEYIDGVNKQMDADKLKKANAGDAEARVMSRYIEGNQYALDELNGFAKEAQCELKRAEAEQNAFQKSLEAIKSQDTSSPLGKWLIGGSIVLVLGVIGFIVYKKSK